MSQEQDKAFFRNFSLIVGAIGVLMIVFIIAARIIGFDEQADENRKAAAAAQNTAPVAEVSVAEPSQQAAPAPEAAPAPAATEVAAAEGDATPTTDAAPSAGADGKKVYDGLCKACHGSGLPGIPQLGDKEAWAPRIAQGKDTLYQNAIKGFTGKSGMMMPPKGGGANTDDEVKAAVDYMVSNSQ